MNVVIKDVKKFKAIINTMADLTDEVTFKFSSEGLSILEMDPAHIALISLSLKPDAFFDYNIVEPVEFYFDLEEFNRVLKKSRKDSIELVFKPIVDPFSSGVLDVVFRRADVERTFELKLFKQEDVETVKIPDLDFVSMFYLDSKLFVEARCDTNLDYLTLSAIDDLLLVSGKSDNSKYSNKISVESLIWSEVVVRSSFSNEYLKSFTRRGTVGYISDFVFSIYLGEDMPAKFRFTDYLTDFWILLAPRVESK